MKVNKTINKAFTLVELMIVIAIIGVLAATLLPKLQGAQERSRDTGRITSLKNIAAVMQTYFTDEGQYPRSPNGLTPTDIVANSTIFCLSAAGGVVNPDLANLFKGGAAPQDPQKNNTSGACTVAGQFGYASLDKSSIVNGGYVLIANVEAYKKANYDWGTVINQGDNYSSVTVSPVGFMTTETGNALHSVYIEKS